MWWQWGTCMYVCTHVCMTVVCVYVCMSVHAWLVYITWAATAYSPSVAAHASHSSMMWSLPGAPPRSCGSGSNKSCQTCCLDVCCSMYIRMCWDACTNVGSYMCMCVSVQKEQSDKLRANLQYTKEEAYDSAIKYVHIHIRTNVHTNCVQLSLHLLQWNVYNTDTFQNKKRVLNIGVSHFRGKISVVEWDELHNHWNI